jgi:succinate dehydrogenase/fumarate reductase flavoprotein subunit
MLKQSLTQGNLTDIEFIELLAHEANLKSEFEFLMNMDEKDVEAIEKALERLMHALEDLVEGKPDEKELEEAALEILRIIKRLADMEKMSDEEFGNWVLREIIGIDMTVDKAMYAIE